MTLIYLILFCITCVIFMFHLMVRNVFKTYDEYCKYCLNEEIYVLRKLQKHKSKFIALTTFMFIFAFLGLCDCTKFDIIKQFVFNILGSGILTLFIMLYRHLNLYGNK